MVRDEARWNVVMRRRGKNRGNSWLGPEKTRATVRSAPRGWRSAPGPRRRARLGDLARGVDAVQQRHHDIEYRDVGMVLARRGGRRPAVGRFGHHRDAVPLEQGADAVPEHRVIIGQDDLQGHAILRGLCPPLYMHYRRWTCVTVPRS